MEPACVEQLACLPGVPLWSIRALPHSCTAGLTQPCELPPTRTPCLWPPPPRCSGLGPSLLGVMHVVIQFPLYESLKARFAARHADGGPHSEKLNLSVLGRA